MHFPRLLLRKIRGKVLVIWDGPPIERSQSSKAFPHAGVTKCLHLERLPGHAPELNLDEGTWNDLKRVELANRHRDLAELAPTLRRGRERLRNKRTVIQMCIRQAGYHV